MARPIIIDTDPGIDDAVAILLALAAPELTISALVAVAGNLPLAATAGNALRLAELAGRPGLPVFAGCPRPLGPVVTRAEHVHGAGGLGRLVLPEPAIALQRQHGVVHLVETLRSADPHSITLCALGPLTNIAAALVMAPEIAGTVAELVIMGGGTRGNVTPAAEFNIFCDPQAAAIVFDSGMPITLVPLDATEMTASSPDRVAAIARLGSRCGGAVADMLTPNGGWSGASRVLIHDACVIAYLLEPALFGAAMAHVAIETQGGMTRGMTVIERRGRPDNARVLDRVDAEGLYRLLAERLAGLP